MNMLRILVYCGKNGERYWLAHTRPQIRQAHRALFYLLDENGFYDNDEDNVFLEPARDGDFEAISNILESHRSNEYESWDYKEVIIPHSESSLDIIDLLDFNSYQQAAHASVKYPRETGIMYVALGLTGESGEVANQIKKIYRDDKGILTAQRKQVIIRELGDTLWHVAELATLLEVDLATITVANLYRLHKRKAQNKTNTIAINKSTI